MLSVSPLSGVVPPYASATLTATFRPRAPAAAKGFAAQPLPADAQAQPFDGLLQLTFGGGQTKRLPVKGCGHAATLAIGKPALHFGAVPCQEWADATLQLSNGCTKLPMQVRAMCC